MSRRLTLSSLFVLLTAQCNGFQAADPELMAEPVAGPCTGLLAEADVRTDDTRTVTLRAQGCPGLAGTRLDIAAGGLRVPGKAHATVHVQLWGSGSSLARRGESALSQSVSIVTDTPDAVLEDTLLVLPYQTRDLDARGTERPAIYGMKAGFEGVAPESVEYRGAYVMHDEAHGLIGARVRGALTYQGIKTGSPYVQTSKLDALFVIDNSGSMSNKQKFLADAVDRAFREVTGYGSKNIKADCVQYRLGIIDTDLGNSASSADEGDAAKLQAKYCFDRGAQLTSEGVAACMKACGTGDRPMGAIPATNFIDRAVNMDVAEDMKQFKCAAIVGDKGASVEQPLASIARFLKEDQERLLMKKDPFFREDALSSIILLSDEEDCSLKPSRRASFWSEAPADEPSFKCVRTSMKCDSKDMTKATGCRYVKGDSTYLEDVETYIAGMKGFFNTRKSYFSGKELRTVVMSSLVSLPDPIPMFGTGFKIDHTSPSAPLKPFCTDGTEMQYGQITGFPGVRHYEWSQQFHKEFGDSLPMGQSAQVQLENLCNKSGRDAWVDKFAESTFKNIATCKVNLMP